MLAPPRAAELWPQVRARLASARMAQLLGGPGRIYGIADDLSPEGALTASWGRVVVVPVAFSFGPPEDQPGRIRVVPFLIRSEFNRPAAGYDPTLPNELAQAEAFRLLQGWKPAPMAGARTTVPVFRQTQPQSAAQWDADSGLWFMSAEYRAILAPAQSDEE